MAGYASEVKLFGKWSFEDVEVRVLLRRCCAAAASRQAANPGQGGRPCRHAAAAARAASRRCWAAPGPPGAADADAPRVPARPCCSQINDISLEDYIAVKPKYAVYGAFRPRAPTHALPWRRAAVLIAAGRVRTARHGASESQP
jgi:hypothetical protein